MRDKEIEDLLEKIDILKFSNENWAEDYDNLIEEVKEHLDEPTKETAATLEKIISEYEGR